MELTTEDRKALQDAINVLSGVLQQVSPEVPFILYEWPEDDTHLRGEFWRDTNGDTHRFSDGWWQMWVPGTRQWVDMLKHLDNVWAPFARTTDPSLPRTWDTLDDVPEDVERVTGYYLRASRELARSPLSESGWFERPKGDLFPWWMELPAAETRIVKNIKEGQS